MANVPVRAWVYYDAECSFCVRGVMRWAPLFERRGFRWLPLQTPGTAARLGVSDAALREEMHLLLASGKVRRGIDAWHTLWSSIWWLFPLALALSLPGLNALGQIAYRRLAAHRYCLRGRCALHPPEKRFPPRGTLVAALLLPIFAGRFTWQFPAWIFMWSVAIGFGLAGKWITYSHAHRNFARPTLFRRWVWFCAWPGLDAWTFFGTKQVSKPSRRELLWAGAKLALGLACLGTALGFQTRLPDRFIGWMAMVGVVFCLHFGCFHLLSIGWRLCGIPTDPIMRMPLRATSLAEFWGTRWNTAFSIPARRLILLPVTRRMGVNAATILVFAISGILHELVISLPARAGYGLPTGYFLLQALGIWFERSRLGKGLGLGHSWRGRAFVILGTTIPLSGLFPLPFVRHVILPMIQTVGALLNAP